MSFTLKMSGVIVGRSELENRDASRRIASGAFRPGLGYDLVQPVFDLLEGGGGNADAMARYRKSRDALRLELTSASGAPVHVRELHIRRGSTGSPVLEIETDDPAVWSDASASTRS